MTAARFLALLLALSAPLCAATRPHYGGALRLSFSEGAESFDPLLAVSLPERLVSRAVYETLVRLDDRGAPAPGLAGSWESESGGKRWIFELRANVRFHNGKPVNSAAVRESLERSVPRAQSAAAAQLRRVQFLCASPSPNRLACDMAEPVEALPAMLADPALAIADADGRGTGPWKVASWTKGARIRLEASEDYAQGRPFLDAIQAEFGRDSRAQWVDFELKRADVVVVAPTETRTAGQTRLAPPGNLVVLGFSAAVAAPLRRAIPAVLDREALARLLPPGRAEAAKGFLPGWLSGYQFLLSPELPPPPAKGGPVSKLRLIYDSSDAVARLIASRLTLDLRSAGLELGLEGLPPAEFAQARRSGAYDLFLESVRLRTNSAGAALAEILHRYDLPRLLPGAPVSPGAPVEMQYRLEKAALEGLAVLPLLHYSEQYNFQPGLEQVRFDGNGMLDLADSWVR